MSVHSCFMGIQESGKEGSTFNVVQPGSSVATALSEGEAKAKHVMVLEIFEESWRTVKLPLQTVRPFIYDHVCTSACRISSSTRPCLAFGDACRCCRTAGLGASVTNSLPS